MTFLYVFLLAVARNDPLTRSISVPCILIFIMVILPVDAVFSKCPCEHKDARLCQRGRGSWEGYRLLPAPGFLQYSLLCALLPCSDHTIELTLAIHDWEGGQSALCLHADLLWDFALKCSEKKSKLPGTYDLTVNTLEALRYLNG